MEAVEVALVDDSLVTTIIDGTGRLAIEMEGSWTVAKDGAVDVDIPIDLNEDTSDNEDTVADDPDIPSDNIDAPTVEIDAAVAE